MNDFYHDNRRFFLFTSEGIKKTQTKTLQPKSNYIINLIKQLTYKFCAIFYQDFFPDENQSTYNYIKINKL